MISSTSFDLPDHRKAVIDAVIRAECFPLAMEHGTALSASDAVRYSLELVDRADVYLGVFGHRYGYVPDDPVQNSNGWSVTEHEYRHAIESKRSALIFLMADEHPVTIKDVDQEPAKVAKLEALKNELRQGICGFFKSPQELHSLVIQALHVEKRKLGREAASAGSERRTVIPQPPEIYAVAPYVLTNTFVGRRQELAELDAWAASAEPVMVVEAIGGMGKSALCWEWVHRRAESSIPELVGRVWWSFYERGTSMKTFLRHALAYVTRQDPESLRTLSTYDCGHQLLAELRRKPYLLVLDGFERVLTAYYRIDKAQMRDDRVPADKRECTNPKDGDVLRQLVHCGPSKVLVSTRLMPKVLEDKHIHRRIPGVRHRDLEGLAPGDALDLVRNAGINGNGDAILRFSAQFGRHALLLQIVCGLVIDYRPAPCEFDAWRSDPDAGGVLSLSELPLKQRYTHILEYAFRGLEAKTRQLLSRIAALSDSADYDTIAVLNPFLAPWLQQDAPQGYRASTEYHQAMSEFHNALCDLEERGLLQWDRDANTYNLHPVVRALAFEQLEERDRAGTYDAIRDHFASLPPEDVEAATEPAQLKNHIEIMRALIGAARFGDALDFFYRQDLVNRLLHSIGAYHLVAELMRPLLQCNRKGGIVLASTRDRAVAANIIAVALFSLGELEEAVSLFSDAIRLALECKGWMHIVFVLQNCADVFARLNRLALTEKANRLAAKLYGAASGEDAHTEYCLYQTREAIDQGRLDDAESWLGAFRDGIQETRYSHESEEMCLSSLLCFYQGRLKGEDLARAEEVGSEVWAQVELACLRAEWELSLNNSTSALDTIEHALSIVRRTGRETAVCLAIRAVALARLGQSALARESLGEAEEAWNSHGPELARFAAEAWLALGDRDQARRWVKIAYPQAWADGPPYIHWYELKRCRELMSELGEPEPRLPPFDPEKVEPVPFEAEIRAAIKKLEAERPNANPGRSES
jgi:tetratricopeptide (TPR) repeat protein